MAAAAPSVTPRASGAHMNFHETGPAWVANEHLVSAAGAIAVITINADANAPNIIAQVDFGYDATPAAGATLKIEDGAGTIVYQIPVVAAGPYFKTFVPPRCGTKNVAMVVTLTAGGGAVLAYLNVTIYKMP